ncbi:hypothetical protein V1514DRAFT_325344 [Lipomyces japonicus]|uniref:uncharacterized protein n=1 Tax=Lipomyces japonicus TaxID=56871 RepID=UPI0034CF89C0
MSVLELQRYALEDVDQLEKAISDRLVAPPRNHREKIVQQHENAQLLDKIVNQSQFLLDSFKDEDGAREQELATLLGGGSSSPFDEFYSQLKRIKEHHRRYPNQPIENLEDSYRKRRRRTANNGGNEFIIESAGDTENSNGGQELTVADTIDGLFSGEEALGRYLDLISLHEQYLNQKLTSVRRVSYLQYLDLFDKFSTAIINSTKRDEAYAKYVSDLRAYLEGFLRRTEPLNDPDGVIVKINADFEASVEAANNGKTYDDDDHEANRLYCKYCDRRFEKQTVFDAHLNGKKHKKNEAAAASVAASDDINNNNNGTAKRGKQELRAKQVSRDEFAITKLAQLLSKAREDTKVNVERKAALTDRERQLELEALEREADDDGYGEGTGDQDEDGQQRDADGAVYNPLNLPLGWDGKPIPFWLWKLHGLGVEYPCEICGNYIYMGRKAFEKHFVEARHVHGLKCLGVQSSSMFREITSIEDALKLWDKIKKDRRQQDSWKEQAVEVEDDEGNVMSEKVYNDLRKQGLV